MRRPVNRKIGEFRGVRAEVLNHRVWGVGANALILRLPETCDALSSRDGFQPVKAICNCYLPEELWPAFHSAPDKWPDYLAEVLDSSGLDPEVTAALSTGVNMDYVAWEEETFEELWALAFVTAGVSTNAMRIGMDKADTMERDGSFEKVGTINTIVLTGAQLDLTTLAASFITITEAKNIALQEMDVRSCYTPEWLATGTGTDQIITVSGHSGKCKYVGGHTKLGEMIAKATTKATIQAIKNSLKGAE